jgi:hypothetical protein
MKTKTHFKKYIQNPNLKKKKKKINKMVKNKEKLKRNEKKLKFPRKTII